MYAIVKTGGKQYKASVGETIIVEKLEGEAGVNVEFSEVVLVVDGESTTLGAPFVKGARVVAQIIRQAKSAKINAFNYKAKKNERKRWGHRQPQTFLKITEVVAGN